MKYQRTARPGTINGDLVDRFTLAHAAVGYGYGLLGVKRWEAVVALAIGWELVERPLKDLYPEMFPHSSQDTAENALVDAAAVISGWWLARRRAYAAQPTQRAYQPRTLPAR